MIHADWLGILFGTAMTIEFLSPWWFIPAVGVTVAAFLPLFVRGPTPLRMSTLQFWENEARSVGRRDSKRIDLLWLLIAIATMIAALAMIRPQITIHHSGVPNSIPLKIVCAGGALPGSKTGDIFLRYLGGTMPHQRMLSVHVAWQGGDWAGQISVKQLRNGMTFGQIPSAASLWHVGLVADGKRIWAQTLRLRVQRAINVNFLDEPPSALQRLLRVVPGLAFSRSDMHPNLWIMSSPDSVLSDSAIVRGDTVLAIGPAVLPGMHLKSKNIINLNLGSAKWDWRPRKISLGRLLRHVTFKDTKVSSVYDASMDTPWKVLVSISNGLPLIAQRYRKSTGVWYVWIGVPLTEACTNWEDKSSFVIFFANLLQRARRAERPVEIARQWIPWPQHRLALQQGHKLVPVNKVIHLDVWMILFACVLILLAMVGFVQRFSGINTRQ